MTFSREIMASLCLAIVFVNTLLITADVGGWLLSLARFRSLLAPGSKEKRLFRGTLQGGPERPALELVLVGHGRGEGKIFFHDRKQQAIVPEGTRLISLDQPAIPPPLLEANNDARIWPDEAIFRQHLACPGNDEFDRLAPHSEQGRGTERVIRIDLDDQQNVYVFGKYEPSVGSITPAPLNLDPSAPARLIVACFDPRAWALTQIAHITLTLLAIWATFAGLVGLCFVGPAFGPWSRIGAVGLLGFFLLVQPLGVALRERTSLPHEVPRTPIWKRSRKSPPLREKMEVSL